MLPSFEFKDTDINEFILESVDYLELYLLSNVQKTLLKCS